MTLSRRTCLTGAASLAGAAGLAVLAPGGPARAADEGCDYAVEAGYPVFRPDPDAVQAAWGSAVSASIVNYNRASPYVGAAGLLLDGGVDEAGRLGFRLIVDLRGEDEEGVADEVRRASASGIDYLNIPVTTRAPTGDQVARFGRIVEDSARYPILFHCVSSNRSGAMWALYRASRGVPALIAIEEGRTNGLTSREGAVREALVIL